VLNGIHGLPGGLFVQKVKNQHVHGRIQLPGRQGVWQAVEHQLAKSETIRRLLQGVWAMEVIVGLHQTCMKDVVCHEAQRAMHETIGIDRIVCGHGDGIHGQVTQSGKIPDIQWFPGGIDQHRLHGA